MAEHREGRQLLGLADGEVAAAVMPIGKTVAHRRMS
jgi:hypothetical protein